MSSSDLLMLLMRSSDCVRLGGSKMWSRFESMVLISALGIFRATRRLMMVTWPIEGTSRKAMRAIELDMLQSFRWLELITIFATSKSKYDLYQCPDTLYCEEQHD